MKQQATLKRVLGLVKPYSGFVTFSILGSLISIAVQLLIPILCGNAIDVMLGEGMVSSGEVLQQIIIIAVVTALSSVTQQMLAMCNNRMTYSVCRDLRNSLSRKLHSLPLSYLDRHQSGDLVSRMVADVDTFADGLLMGFTQLFTGVITIVGTLAIMLWMNGAVAIAVVVLTPMSIFVARFISTRAHKYFQEQAQFRGEQTSLINELVEGQRIIKAFGHEHHSLRDFDTVNERLRKSALNATFFSSLTNPGTRLVNNVVYAVVTLMGALYTISGRISIGQFSCILSYAGQYARPFNEISGVLTEFQNAIACAQRIFDLLDVEDEVPDTDSPLSPLAEGHVELLDVSFRYIPNRPLIEHFSLSVQSGQRIAIVGPTGCGKTTLINLLMRFYDVNEGMIKVDGVNIRSMTRHDLRSRYGMVLQDTWLCSGTIRENIAYGRPNASEEEIINAAKSAHAHSFIRRLPEGYDTVITENGGNLSAGQRQLLCIARVMLCLPPMLILDEATSSIDTRTEVKIQSAFTHMMDGRTSFIVAHRLSTIREADVILVMQDGKIVEQGSHDKLIAQNGLYTRLYNSQFSKSM